MSNAIRQAAMEVVIERLGEKPYCDVFGPLHRYNFELVMDGLDFFETRNVHRGLLTVEDYSDSMVIRGGLVRRFSVGYENPNLADLIINEVIKRLAAIDEDERLPLSYRT